MSKVKENSQVRTLDDIARLAGVSKSTASRALNDSSLIGEDTKARVRAIARQYNFQLNQPARRLSLQKSNAIAFVACGYHKEFTVADLFVLEILGGITKTLHENGYDLLMVNVDPHDTRWIHQYISTGRVDGFILMTSERKNYHIKALVEHKAPFIVWGMPQPGFKYCTVNGDNVTGGKLAAQHLVELGRKRIAFLGGPEEEVEVQQRFEGYKDSLERAGVQLDPTLVAYGDFSDTSGAEAMQQLLDHSPDLDAVFVNSDLMAIAAIEVLQTAGRRVPQDVAVVGYDDLSIAARCNPPLTTIRQNIHMAGRLLAQNLLQNLETGLMTNVSLPVELVVRRSA